jgi:ATP-dependent helicase Lhr and Lhr-like helicase
MLAGVRLTAPAAGHGFTLHSAPLDSAVTAPHNPVISGAAGAAVEPGARHARRRAGKQGVLAVTSESSVSAFQKLHPAVQHHIENSLGWPLGLSSEQLAAIEPILAGHDCLLLPFADGGEIEAAALPTLSRMIAESWGGTSVLYVCPLKGQLFHVEPRLALYFGLLGRTVGVWHSEVSAGNRRAVAESPPDVLLTTPEALDGMLVSRKVALVPPLNTVRTVIAGELQAFAGDDRGWHLRATLARLGCLGRRPPQLIAMSAPLGNPAQLLRWLTGGDAGVCIGRSGGPAEADVEIDHAGSLAGAAARIAANPDAKRLVFCDGAARVEELARALRRGSQRVFVSHSSLSSAARRAAETAFVQAHNCVIAATGTLELGAELGDVDAVIQIDAPGTVSSFLQRMGRSGRRRGGLASCLFLTTRPESFLTACALTRLWREGHVEEIQPAPAPWRVVLQQLLALLLEHGPLQAADLSARLLRAFPEVPQARLEDLVEHLKSTDILRVNGARLALGKAGERRFGRRRFRALTAVFLGSSPDFLVQHGRRDIGHVAAPLLLPEEDGPAVLSVAGQAWRVKSVDWRRHRAAVVGPEQDPAERFDTRGCMSGYALAQAVRNVLADGGIGGARLSEAAQAQLAAERRRHSFLGEPGACVISDDADATRLWTFGGLRCNQALARALAQQGLKSHSSGDLRISLPPGCGDALKDRLPGLAGVLPAAAASFAPEGVSDEQLRFVEALPPPLRQELATQRLLDLPAAQKICATPVRRSSGGG